MKKKIFITAALLIGTIGVFAQTSLGPTNANPYHFGRFRIEAAGGIRHLIANSPENSDESYERHLRTGGALDITATINVQPNWGIGFKYNWSQKSHSGEYNIGPGVRAEDKVSITFCGPTFFYRSGQGEGSVAFTCSFGVGYLGMRDKGRVGNINAVLYGSTVGSYTDMGLEIRLAPKLYLTGRAYVIGGVIDNMTLDESGHLTGLENSKNNITSIGVLGGLKIGF